MLKLSPVGCSWVWGCSLFCLHPLLLNHISEVRAGLCAAYTAERERKSGLESDLTPTVATAHAELLFRGRMIDRDEGRWGSISVLRQWIWEHDGGHVEYRHPHQHGGGAYATGFNCHCWVTFYQKLNQCKMFYCGNHREPRTGLKVRFWQDDLKPQEHHWDGCAGEPRGSRSGPGWNPSSMKASTFVTSLKFCFYFVVVRPRADGGKWLMSFWFLT